MILLLLALTSQAAVGAEPRRPMDRLLAPLRGERPPVAAATRREAEGAVEEGFPRFDADGDGGVDRAEFARWMAALAPGAPAGAAAAPGWAARAFEEADADGDGRLSRGELARFLADTASWRLPGRAGGTGREHR